jgi:hypothetical protein
MRGVPDFIGCGGLQRTERAFRALPLGTDPSSRVKHCFLVLFLLLDYSNTRMNFCGGSSFRGPEDYALNTDEDRN